MSASSLQGWQFHQSHAQVTVVFYVTLSTRSSDLSIHIADDYVIAGIRDHPPVLKARLYARIDAATSSWQLERSRRQSRRSSSPIHHAVPSTSSAERSEAGVHTHRRQMSSGSSSSGSSQRRRTWRHRQAPSGTTSPSSGASSYELLQASTISFQATSPPQVATSIGSDDERPFAFEFDSNNPSSPSSTSRSPRSPRSESSRMSLPTHTDEHHDPPSMSSSGHFGAATSTSSASQPSSRDPDELNSARLVTIHLNKIDVGMWPSLISGPAPLNTDHESDPAAFSGSTATAGSSTLFQDIHTADSIAEHGTSPSSDMTHSSTSRESSDVPAARNTPASQGRRGRPRSSTGADSTTSLNSDDSHTLLAHQRSSASFEECRTRYEEARFNMDPVSLVLIGLQTRKNEGGGQSETIHEWDRRRQQAWNEGFEYFARSWRCSDLPVAIRLLVEDYLPVETDGQKATPAVAPARQRLIAALGGNTALARLYAAYARLSLTCSSNHASTFFLFPTGSGYSRDPYSNFGLTNQGWYDSAWRKEWSDPSTGGSAASSLPSSPTMQKPRQDHRRKPTYPEESPRQKNEAVRLKAAGPLTYLEAARLLDPSIQIEAAEWEEAKRIAHDASLEADAEQLAEEEAEREIRHRQPRRQKSPRGSRGDFAQGRGTSLSASRRMRSRRAKKEGRIDEERKRSRPQTGDHDAVLATVVGGAAVVSFVVAGSMAMLSWWKRGPGSTNALGGVS